MPFTLSPKSRAQLQGVHPELVAIVERAIVLTVQDFAVTDGVRSESEQCALVESGASRTMASKHRVQADTYGHAVDLVPYIAGRVRWEWPPIYRVAAAVRAAAVERDVALTWGGVWDRDLRTLPADAAGLERAVAEYAARRKAAGRSAFLDGPHYELRA